MQMKARLRADLQHYAVVVFNRLRQTKSGAEGDRTLDLNVANVALSQLSYRPMKSGNR